MKSRLIDSEIKNAKAETKRLQLADGGGLVLHVMPTGSKLWRYRYFYNGVEKMLSLGSYPEVSLKAARLARDKARELLNTGIDPSQNRNEEKIVRAQAVENHFKAVAMAWWQHWRIGKAAHYA
ncbi:MAG: Arm DNA-binding domain-containing protein [Formosimonas sp.]